MLRTVAFVIFLTFFVFSAVAVAQTETPEPPTPAPTMTPWPTFPPLLTATPFPTGTGQMAGLGSVWAGCYLVEVWEAPDGDLDILSFLPTAGGWAWGEGSYCGQGAISAYDQGAISFYENQGSEIHHKVFLQTTEISRPVPGGGGFAEDYESGLFDASNACGGTNEPIAFPSSGGEHVFVPAGTFDGCTGDIDVEMSLNIVSEPSEHCTGEQYTCVSSYLRRWNEETETWAIVVGGQYEPSGLYIEEATVGVGSGIFGYDLHRCDIGAVSWSVHWTLTCGGQAQYYTLDSVQAMHWFEPVGPTYNPYSLTYTALVHPDVNTFWEWGDDVQSVTARDDSWGMPFHDWNVFDYGSWQTVNDICLISETFGALPFGQVARFELWPFFIPTYPYLPGWHPRASATTESRCSWWELRQALTIGEDSETTNWATGGQVPFEVDLEFDQDYIGLGWCYYDDADILQCSTSLPEPGGGGIIPIDLEPPIAYEDGDPVCFNLSLWTDALPGDTGHIWEGIQICLVPRLLTRLTVQGLDVDFLSFLDVFVSAAWAMASLAVIRRF